jgi:hypothetical protein
MYIRVSLVPTFPSENKISCSCQSSPLVILVALPGEKVMLVTMIKGFVWIDLFEFIS